MIAQILFFAYWLLKAFYFTSSGGLQVGDFFFIASFAVLVLSHLKKKELPKPEKIDIPFIIFAVAAVIINASHFFIYRQTDFIMSSLYIVFNFCIIWSFRELCREKNFIRNFTLINTLCILIQFVVFLMGKGRYLVTSKHERYMGTLNDPNQFAFFLMSRFFICFICFTLSKRKRIVDYICIIATFCISFVLILYSNSVGMLIGMMVFALSHILLILYTVPFNSSRVPTKDVPDGTKPKKKSLRIIYCSALSLIILSTFVFLYFQLQKADSFIYGFSSVSRILQKLKSLSGSNLLDLYATDRALLPFFRAPKNCIFGSGEGAITMRFYEFGATNELHSTILSLLFYYGIIPFLILEFWCFLNIRKSNRHCICVYIGLFAEAMTLINHRQASFWILLILPFVLSNSAMSEHSDISRQQVPADISDTK